MPEAVDRLRLVADGEQVVALERLQHVELQPVRVLELVDHDQVESLRPARAGAGVGREQVAHAQLEVLEVDARARRLGRGVRAAEAVEQVVEQPEDRAGVVVGARRVEVAPGVAVGGADSCSSALAPVGSLAASSARGEPGTGAQRRRQSARVARASRRRASAAVTRAPFAGAERIAAAAAAAAARRAAGSGAGRRRRELQARPALPAAAQRGVGARDHGLEVAAVGGGDVDRRRAVRRRPAPRAPSRTRRAATRRAAPSSSTAKRGSSPAASGWARRTRAQKPWIVPIQAASTARACSSSPSSVNRRRIRSRSSRGRLLREREGEDRADRDAVEQHRLDEALDHHRGLAGARAGGEQRRAVAVGDRRPLLRREAAGRRRGRGGRGGRHAGSSTFGSPARQMPG